MTCLAVAIEDVYRMIAITANQAIAAKANH